MLLKKYLEINNMDMQILSEITGISKKNITAINKKALNNWKKINFDMLANVFEKDIKNVIEELERLDYSIKKVQNQSLGKFNVENRRYIGSKNKLAGWIASLLQENTEGTSFFDVFSGTSVVTYNLLEMYDSFIINDFLYSNECIYNAFYNPEHYSIDKLNKYRELFNDQNFKFSDDDYFEDNYGGRYFSHNDAKKIGEIRNIIDTTYELNNKEKNILIASLIYSADKIANTVGHYEAYRKGSVIKDRFVFDLINPLDTSSKNIQIYRKNANELVKEVSADIVFIDPPYNSRQYSRFYHVLEGIAKWDKPELSGVAKKPPFENMSEYSRSTAPQIFDDLINNISAKYIVVTYNNTYNSKSSSSKNKITHEEILKSLNSVGTTKVFEKSFNHFNAGKTSLNDHKEYVFITKVHKKVNI